MTPRHALYAGWVVGQALAAGLDVRPILDDDGNYTDRFALDVDRFDRGESVGSVVLTVVVPPPPDEWEP